MCVRVGQQLAAANAEIERLRWSADASASVTRSLGSLTDGAVPATVADAIDAANRRGKEEMDKMLAAHRDEIKALEAKMHNEARNSRRTIGLHPFDVTLSSAP